MVTFDLFLSGIVPPIKFSFVQRSGPRIILWKNYKIGKKVKVAFIYYLIGAPPSVVIYWVHVSPSLNLSGRFSQNDKKGEKETKSQWLHKGENEIDSDVILSGKMQNEVAVFLLLPH